MSKETEDTKKLIEKIVTDTPEIIQLPTGGGKTVCELDWLKAITLMPRKEK
jgi:superfamily II DNA or RNA helicase